MRENLTGLNQHIDIKAITQVKLDITFSSKLLRQVYGYSHLFIAQSINISQQNILDRVKGMMPFSQYLRLDKFSKSTGSCTQCKKHGVGRARVMFISMLLFLTWKIRICGFLKPTNKLGLIANSLGNKP
jgi:hypothetical protein